MTIKLDSTVGNHIDSVCLIAARVAVWAADHPESLTKRDGCWVAFWDEDPLVFCLAWDPKDHVVIDGDFKTSEWWAFREFIERAGVKNVPVPMIHAQVEGSEPDGAVEFTFNDAKVRQEPIGPDENVSDLAILLRQQWDATRQANHDAYWTPEKKEEARLREVERQKEDDRRKVVVHAAVAKFPFHPKDEIEYARALGNNQDPYGAACYRYAEAWASVMEMRMAEGATILDCAKGASREADIEGITGFMYGCAATILSTFWKHGEELRRWHNLDTQIGDEGEKANESGGVLNPAVLTVGG